MKFLGRHYGLWFPKWPTVKSRLPLYRGNSSGFTIVETLIVLAIAGLILMMVFLAIPQLERSSSNSQRKQAVQSILEAVSDYELDNSGDFPSACGTGALPLCNVSCTNPNPNPVCEADPNPTRSSDFFMQYNETGFTIYQASDISSHPQTSATRANQAALTAGSDVRKVEVFNYEKCSTSTPGAATIVGAGYSDVVALYGLESGNKSVATPQCEQLN
jgi:prepilin-type N-terminal cleavage/methylation domain-containing protein